MSPSCDSEYASEYAQFIGINSACKLRWSGQWPANVQNVAAAAAAAAVAGHPMSVMSIAQQLATDGDDELRQQLADVVEMQQRVIDEAEAARLLNPNQTQAETLMQIDHQLHQQIQQHLTEEQYEMLSQLQVSGGADPTSFYFLGVGINL